MARARVEIRLAALGAALGCGLAWGAPAGAVERNAIAIFRGWGAFREGSPAAPTRCYAIAEPPPFSTNAGRGAFAAVASFPGRRIRAQVSIHLSHALGADAPVTLAIGDASFRLVATARSAWAHDRRQDAAIVATMRSGSSMSISGVDAHNQPFADVYRLRGAASAIDAAALACPMR